MANTAPIRGEFREVAKILSLDSERTASIYPDMSEEYEDQWSTPERYREGDGVWGVVVNDMEGRILIAEKWGIFGYEAAMGLAYEILEEG